MENFKIDNFAQFKDEFHSGLSNNIQMHDIKYESNQNFMIKDFYPISKDSFLFNFLSSNKTQIFRYTKKEIRESEQTPIITNDKLFNKTHFNKRNEKIKEFQKKIEQQKKLKSSSVIESIKILEGITNKKNLKDEDAEGLQMIVLKRMVELEAKIKKKLNESKISYDEMVDIENTTKLDLDKTLENQKYFDNKYKQIIEKNAKLSSKSNQIFNKLQQLTKNLKSINTNEMRFNPNNLEKIILKKKINESKHFVENFKNQIEIVNY